ncbi:MAG: hypothetical protein V8R46_10835 [Eubacterium ramulus]
MRERVYGFLWILYGKEFEAYRFLGAHACERGTVFRTFAPNAQRISLIGEFNGWQETPMQKVHDGNFWECYVENAGKGMMYKYKIYGADGSCIDHSDPYGFYSVSCGRIQHRLFMIGQDYTFYRFERG